MFGIARAKQSADQQPVVKFGSRQRTALGDITNAVGEERNRELPKKKQNPFTAIQPAHPSVSVPIDASRGYMQRACDDIDERDSDNPLLVTDYVNEMYDHFNNVEKDFMVNSNYMSRQEFVNEKMRAILMDWLVRRVLLYCVVNKFNEALSPFHNIFRSKYT